MSDKQKMHNRECLSNGMLRRSLRMEDWPDDICNKWTAYKVRCDDGDDDLLSGFDDDSGIGTMAETSLTVTENLVGRWLLHALNRQVDPVPMDNTYRQWLRYEHEVNGLSSATLQTCAFRLWRFATIVWPEECWDWMKPIWRGLKKQMRPARNKSARIRRSSDIEALGYGLMNDAVKMLECGRYQQRAAVRYRDGLMLAMWSEKPLRLANMTVIRFADFVSLPDGRVRLNVVRTKNGDADEATYSADIAAALEDWRDVFRRILKPASDCDAVWIGRLGKPMKSDGLYQACIYRTGEAFGTPINPHLMRDCAARTVAEHSPEASHAISTLLGHRDRRSAAYYTGQAMMIGGAVAFDGLLETYRVPPQARRKG